MIQSKFKIKKIIRICRTWPTKKFCGVGLHAYYYSKYIDIPTDVFVKDIDSNDMPLNLKNVSFIHVKYKDILLNKTNSKLQYFLILITKLKGEIIMFLRLFNSIDKRFLKESILHIHSANYILGGFLISYLYKIPIILQLGGTDIVRIENSFIHKKILKRIQYFICVNDNIKKKVKLINNRANIKIVGNSADLDLFKSYKKNINQYTSVGNLRWQKNFTSLIS